ncbi:uncharacterized protein LOC131266433 [Anopheles coustani]|uniref:uncharacterized protein LOC131266433 n=1 Tax=Anopheles coustani TaxID=139045 RepID=UPI00265A06B4|nr:uncharacterized protein LOC131266433 [Anopheles coustani]
MTSTVMSAARSNGADERSGYGSSEDRFLLQSAALAADASGGGVGGGDVEGHRKNGGNNSAGSAMASKNLIASESVEKGLPPPVGAGSTLPSQYNNSNLIKNFKNGKAEKKGKTFLSRISSGFRFSFRNKSKKGAGLKETTFGVTGSGANVSHGLPPLAGSANNGATYNNNNNVKGKPGKASTMPSARGNDSASADFIYIPLKDPRRTDESAAYLRQMNTSGVTVDDSFTGAEDEPDDCEIAVTRPPGAAPYRSDSSTALNGEGGGNGFHHGHGSSRAGPGNQQRAGTNHVLSSKPPLPKQPPRVVGVCAKRSSTSPASAKHAHAQRASSTPPREIDDDEPDCASVGGSGSYYRRSPSQYAANGSSYSGADTVSVEGTLPSAALLRSHYADYGDEYEDEDEDGQQRFYYGHHRSTIMGSEQKIGLIETNLDTHETVISGKTRSLMELGAGGPHYRGHHPGQRRTIGGVGGQMNGQGGGPGGPGEQRTRPHKSMEFLLDKENQRNVLPPENELQKSHETGTNLSEHQLRVQASLQRLNIPDWYKQYSGKDGPAGQVTGSPASNTPGAPGAGAGGGILRKRNSDVGRWTGLSSKTTSLSSLGSHRSDRSPVMLSPSAHSHHGQTGFSRWSTSHLNSNQTSPSVSTRGSFTRGGLNASVISGYSTASTTTGAGVNSGPGGGPSTIRNSFRQPYLGWRSQEKLSQPRTPAERLASSLLQQQEQQKGNRQHQQQKEESVVTPEIQSSIIEVTSAIVHYVNDQTNRHSRSRSTSPSQRCWLESSFVGTRPLDSPQTPMIENSSVLGSSHQKQHQQQQQQQQTAGDHYRFNAGMNGVVCCEFDDLY